MVVGFDPSGYFQDGNILFGQALSSTYFAKMLFLLILVHRKMTECLCYQQQTPIDCNHKVAKIYIINMENPNIS